MDLELTDRTPSPLVRLVGTIGLLNLVIGFGLFMSGLQLLSRFGPSLAQNRPLQLEPGEVQHLYEQTRQDLIRTFEARARAAEDPAEKTRFEEKRRAAAAQPRADVERRLDLAAVNHHLLWLSWYVWLDVTTGPVLNLLMIASGIGLTQMRTWARKLGLWVAVLKIVRLTALTALLILVVIPHVNRAVAAFNQTELGDILVANLNNVQTISTGRAEPATPLTRENVVAFVSLLQHLAALFVLVLGLIYPAITLAILTRPGVRAACLLGDEAETDDAQPVSW